mmetsp:Transcript_13909/g.25745  ORF Transcript_13909/g.25745 Transcript_13909/m.25745 type:complete len:109 (+) Transcript_13909:106-432(+)
MSSAYAQASNVRATTKCRDVDATSETEADPKTQPGDGLAAARLMKPGSGALESTQSKVEDMKEYVQKSECSKVLQELYERLIIDQPEDPVEYLIEAVKIRVRQTGGKV